MPMPEPSHPSQPAPRRRRADDAPSSRGAGTRLEAPGDDRRGSVVDQRLPIERRTKDVGSPTGLERRRGPGRRLSDFNKSAEEGDLTPEQFLFVMAIDAFKKANAKTYPSWTDVLEVIRLLGYRKTMASEIRLRSAEDWREAPDAPSNVRTERQKQRAAAAERQAEREAA